MNLVPSSALQPDRRRWTALFVVCLAQLMVVLDVTIVNVALPSIQHDLHFSQASLTWVVNAFLVTFGSLLLLAGRLGDLVGRKRVFLAGVATFTVASLVCGVAPSAGALIGARFLQGVGAAAQASVILAIIITEFPKPSERARAMSAYVFVSVAGGSLGLLAGGVLTEALSWHWVFFVNLPIGVAAFVLGQILIPEDKGIGLGHGVDWIGSVLVTTSMMSAIYAIIQATSHGWLSSDTLGFGVLAAVLPRHRDVLDVLPRHALPGARPALQRSADGRRIPALDAHGRSAVAGDHGASRRTVRTAPCPDDGHGERGGGAAAVQHGRA
jgi:MFS family permease